MTRAWPAGPGCRARTPRGGGSPADHGWRRCEAARRGRSGRPLGRSRAGVSVASPLGPPRCQPHGATDGAASREVGRRGFSSVCRGVGGGRPTASDRPPSTGSSFPLWCGAHPALLAGTREGWCEGHTGLVSALEAVEPFLTPELQPSPRRFEPGRGAGGQASALPLALRPLRRLVASASRAGSSSWSAPGSTVGSRTHLGAPGPRQSPPGHRAHRDVPSRACLPAPRVVQSGGQLTRRRLGK